MGTFGMPNLDKLGIILRIPNMQRMLILLLVSKNVMAKMYQ